MIDHHVYRDDRAQEPPNEDEILGVMAVPRASLSPSRFGATTFRAFRSSDAQANDEDDVLHDVIPFITGTNNNSHFMARSTIFGNLEPLTSGELAPANPDIYYGARPEYLDREVRDELTNHIIPSTMDHKPMAPNFFMEVKGPDGNAAVAARQVLYDGAVGARGMHSLQTYGQAEPTYDGNAYTYSATYHRPTLQLYEHHITAPTTPGGQPEYHHMTQLDGWVMTSNIYSFRRGATAFRNLRDLAKQHRDGFIQAANTKVRRSGEENPTGTAVVQPDEGLSPDEFVDCEEFPAEDVDQECFPPPH
jgi:hypothetical protein